jgi:hypothetical protein
MMTRAIELAVKLLRDDNLVWSADIEDIKGDIVALLLVCAAQDNLSTTLADNLAKKFCFLEDQETFVDSYDLNLEKRDA